MVRLCDLIKKYRVENKMSMQAFAAKCGLSKGYVSMLENEFEPSYTEKKIIPSLKTFKKLAIGLDIDVNDLLSIVDSDISLTENDDSSVTLIETIIFDDYFPLHYSTNLSAGNLDELLEAEPNAIVYVPIMFQSKKDRLHAFKVNGTSMDNVIPDGSIVIAEDISGLCSEIVDGMIVVAWVDGQATVKRIYIGEKQVTLMPDSHDKNHMPIVINTDIQDVKIIGKVIWHMNPDDIEKTY